MPDQHLYWPWSLVFTSISVFAAVACVVVSIIVVILEMYALLPISVGVFFAILMFHVFPYENHAIIEYSISTRLALSVYFITIALLVILTGQIGVSLISYGLLAIVAACAAAICVSECVSDWLRTTVIGSFTATVALFGQLAHPKGLWEPDTLTIHGPIISEIVFSGSLPLATSDRVLFPMHHLQVASLSLLTETGSLDAYIFLAGGVSVSMCITIFALVRSVLDSRIAALAALIPSIGDYGHFAVTHPGKMTFGYGVLVFLLFSIRMYQYKNPSKLSRSRFLSVIIILGVVMASIHPFSSVVAAVVLVLYGIISVDSHVRRAVAVYFIALSTQVTIIGYPQWTSFIGAAIADAVNLLMVSSGDSVTQEAGRISRQSPLELVFHSLGTTIILMGVAWGGLYLLRDRNRAWRSRVSLVFSAFLLLIIAVGMIADLRYVLPQRWYLLGYLIAFNVLFAIGISRIGWRGTSIAAITLITFIGPMTAVAGYSTAIMYDQPHFKSYGEADDFAATEWQETYLDSVVGPYGPQGSGNVGDIKFDTDGSIIPQDDTPIMYSDTYSNTGVLAEDGDGMQVGDRNYFRVNDDGLNEQSHVVYETGSTRVYIPIRNKTEV